MPKKKATKISASKRNNQKRTKLAKQGKLKLQRHRKAKKHPQKQNVPKPQEAVEEESDQGEDLMDMFEEDDLNYLKSSVSNPSYSIYKKIRFQTNEEDLKSRRKKKRKAEESTIEDKYEEFLHQSSEDTGAKRVKLLLPVKKQDGTVESRFLEEDIDEEVEKEDEAEVDEDGSKEPADSDEEMLMSADASLDKKPTQVSTVELMACREEVLRLKKFKIGLLSSSILENPEIKINNFKALLDFMEESNPEVYITVKKLATMSLLEVFKDVLPTYQINVEKQEGVKFKKETLQLQNYESTLLQYYKKYLQKLEKLAGILRKKKGDTRVISEPELQLGEIAVASMCNLLVEHPYFNFSTNIANFLVPLLDNRRPTVREKVSQCLTEIFKTDKRGDLSLTIVRKINQYVKTRGHSVYSETLSVLLALRIKDVNLDKEREEEMKQKKLMSHKQRVLALSKRERKKDKKLKEIESEMMETKAEENKMKKQKTLTEITSVVFTIYFRIIKQAPNSKVLSVCLEGLAKFAHCINLDFYQDLVLALNQLMEDGNLGQREQLHCIQTVFTILSGQVTTLNIDPHKFYGHLYKLLLNIHMGRTQEDSEVLIECLENVLVHRRKRVTQNRLVAFIKRMTTLALQLQHHGALGVLGVVRSIFQLCKNANILLDTDSNVGDGFYQPEIDEPEFCNAHRTAVWELVALQRHYHTVVQKVARNIACEVPTSGDGSLAPDISKLSTLEMYRKFDPSGVVFNPPVPAPIKGKFRQINA